MLYTYAKVDLGGWGACVYILVFLVLFLAICSTTMTRMSKFQI